LFALALVAQPAFAVPKLTLSIDDGINPAIVISDTAHDGSLAFAGTLGDFTLDLKASGVGSANPLLGGLISLDAINIASTSDGTLMLMLTETNLTAPTALVEDSLTGVLGNNHSAKSLLTFNRYIDDGNVAFGTASLLGSTNIWGRGAPLNVADANLASVNRGYSETLVIKLRATANSTSSFVAQLEPLPEPGSLALFGGALGLMALTRRMRAGRLAARR
jgi:hypothetical protein